LDQKEICSTSGQKPVVLVQGKQTVDMALKRKNCPKKNQSPGEPQLFEGRDKKTARKKRGRGTGLKMQNKQSRRHADASRREKIARRTEGLVEKREEKKSQTPGQADRSELN